MFSFGASPLLGLDVGSSTIKGVELEKKNGRVVVRRAGIAGTPAKPLPAVPLFQSPGLAEAIRKLCREQKLRGKRVALGLGGEDVVVTRVRIERAGEVILAARLREEAARQAPFPLEQASLDFQVLEQPADADWIAALVVAAHEGRVRRAQQLLQQAGKDLAIVDSAACALINAYEFNYQPATSEVVALVHVGSTVLTICVLRGATPLVVRDRPLASGDLANRIVIEVARVFALVDENAREHPGELRSSQIQRLLLSGGGCRLQGLEEALRERIRLPIEELNPFRQIEFDAADSFGRLVSENVNCMPIAVGLALRGLEPAA